MSFQATAWAYSLNLGSASQKAVLLYLAQFAHEDGSCTWPSVPRIMAATELGERTVRRALTSLQARGVITLGDQRHAELGKHGTTIPRNRRSRVWDLNMDVKPEQLPGVRSTDDAYRELRDRMRGVGDGMVEADDVDSGMPDVGVQDMTENGLGCHNGTSWGATVAPNSLIKTNNYYPFATKVASPRKRGPLPEPMGTDSVEYPESTMSGDQPIRSTKPLGPESQSHDARTVRDNPTVRSPKAGRQITRSHMKSIEKERESHLVADSVDSPRMLEARRLAELVKQLLEIQQIPAPEAFVHPKRRDLEAFASLVERHGFRKVMQAVKWVYSPLRADEQVGDWVSGRGWWRTRIVSPRAFRSKWDAVAVQLAVDPMAGVFLNGDGVTTVNNVIPSMKQRRSVNRPTGRKPHRHTWACKHTLAALGVESTMGVDFDEACRVAERLNREGA